MKTVLKIIAAVIFIGSVTAFVRIGGNEKPVPTVKAELIGWVKINNSYHLKTKISLINNSPDTIYCGFFLHSGEYKTNTVKLYLPDMGGDTDGFYIKTIPPMNRIVDSINLWASIVSDNPEASKIEKEKFIGLKFRVGLVFIRASRILPFNPAYHPIDNPTYYPVNYRKDTILWSNELEIAKDLPITLAK